MDDQDSRMDDPRGGMQLLQNYFSGPNAHRRVLLFENFVNILGGQEDNLGYGDNYRNGFDGD
jgi:hypothetical protein